MGVHKLIIKTNKHMSYVVQVVIALCGFFCGVIYEKLYGYGK